MKKSKEVSYHTLSFICSLANVLRPKEEMTVREWADRHMVLPAGSNESGRFSTKNVPFQREIMDAITDFEVKDITIMSSAQVGKTTIILCGIGYFVEQEPATQMILLPTLILGERFSKTRLAPMIRDIDVLAEKIAPAKSKDSDNTILFKQYAGGYILVSGANSAPSLSSMPIRVIWMDEVDRYPDSAGGEGDPVLLAEQRSTTFWNKKHIKTSTPTIKGHSKIEKQFYKGSQEEWCVECPCCGAWQPYEFRRMVFKSVCMTCVSCHEEIPEADWKGSRHKWIAEHPERKTHRSFHLNAMASPWVSWEELIEQFRDAYEEMKKYHDTEKLQVFINTKLGEPWDAAEADDDEKMDTEILQKKAEHYRADIPDGVLLLTAAVDVQDDRFEVEVKGWARNMENWGIYKTEIYGDLEKREAWDSLENYLKTTFRFEDGRELNVAGVAVDTGGHHTNRTYKWVKAMKKKGKNVFGIKGYAQKPNIPLLYKRTKVDIKKEQKNGTDITVDSLVIHILGVDAGKDDIHKWLKTEEPGECCCHFPSNHGRGYDKAYYEGLLSESPVYKKVRGVIKKSWKKKSGARNEPLDLFNYNYACMELLRPVWGELESKLNSGINYVRQQKKKKIRKSYGGLEV